MSLSGSSLAIIRSVYPDRDFGSMGNALGGLGSIVEAIPYRWLFWPDLELVFDAVFVDVNGVGAGEYRKRIEPIKATAAGESEWGRLVNSFNQFEVSHLFRNVGDRVEFGEDVQLTFAELLIAPWTAKLALEYPDRNFTVRIAPPSPELEVSIEVLQDLA